MNKWALHWRRVVLWILVIFPFVRMSLIECAILFVGVVALLPLVARFVPAALKQKLSDIQPAPYLALFFTSIFIYVAIFLLYVAHRSGQITPAWPLPNLTSFFYEPQLIYKIGLARYGPAVAVVAGEYLSSMFLAMLIFVLLYDILALLGPDVTFEAKWQPGTTEDEIKTRRIGVYCLGAVLGLCVIYDFFDTAKLMGEAIEAGQSSYLSGDFLGSPGKILIWAINLWCIVLFALVWTFIPIGSGSASAE